jgi:hypothetical protein
MYQLIIDRKNSHGFVSYRAGFIKKILTVLFFRPEQ